jgi:hypothetical protein
MMIFHALSFDTSAHRLDIFCSLAQLTAMKGDPQPYSRHLPLMWFTMHIVD